LPIFTNPVISVQAAQNVHRGRGHALGTNWSSAGWFRVGESGPELINMSSGAKVIPNGRLQQLEGVGMRSGGAASSSHVHLSDQSISRLAKAIVAHSSSTVLNELEFAGGY
jgi:phage-related tail protein